MANYTQATGTNGHIKSIVRPGVTLRPLSAHHFQYREGFYCVNEDGIPVVNFHTYPLANKIRINHYYFKSQQDWEEKMRRGLVTQMRGGHDRSDGDFLYQLGLPTIHDDKILRFMPLAQKLARVPINSLGNFVKNNSGPDLDEGLSKINQSMLVNDYAQALKIYLRLKRRHEDLDLDLLGANLFFMQHEQARGLELVSSWMRRGDLSQEDLRKCYEAVANYYKLSNRVNVADSINDYLKA